jgi:type II secretory pathway component PulK
VIAACDRIWHAASMDRLGLDLREFLDQRRLEVDQACGLDRGLAEVSTLADAIGVEVMAARNPALTQAWLEFVDADMAVRAELALNGVVDPANGSAPAFDEAANRLCDVAELRRSQSVV